MSKRVLTAGKSFRSGQKITLARAIGWGVTDCMGGGSGAIIGAYFMFFLTTFMGISALKAAAIMAVSKAIDMVTNVVVGSLSDRLYMTQIGRSIGRRRVFLLIGSPLMLVFGLLWVSGMPYGYYFVVYILFDICDSIVMIPYITLPSEMTDSYTERTLMSTVRMFFSSATGSIATLFSGFLLAVLGDSNPKAYTIMGVVFAVIFAVVVIITFSSTWERPLSELMLEEIAAKKTYRQEFDLVRTMKALWGEIVEYLSTFRIRAFREHLAIYLFGVTAQDVFSQIFMYYVVFDLLRSASFGSSLLSVGLVAVPFTFLWGYLFVRIGASRLYAIAFSMVLLCMGGYYLLFVSGAAGAGLVVAAYAISVVFQIFKSIVYFVPWNVFPFIPDIDEAVTAMRREGRFSGMMNFLRKATSSLAGIVVGFCLDRIGFKAGSTMQTYEVRQGIALIMLVGVGVLSVIALLMALRFHVNRSTHAQLRAELSRLKEGGRPQDVKPDVKKVIEDLTGVPYMSMRYCRPDAAARGLVRGSVSEGLVSDADAVEKAGGNTPWHGKDDE